MAPIVSWKHICQFRLNAFACWLFLPQSGQSDRRCEDKLISTSRLVMGDIIGLTDGNTTGRRIRRQAFPGSCR